MTVSAAPSFVWTASVDRRRLTDAGWDVVEFRWLSEQVIARAKRSSGARQSLASPAERWLSRIAKADQLAIVGVRLETVDDVADLHGYVMEPAWRNQTPLLVESAHRLTQLAKARFVDPTFGFSYTLERAIDVAWRLHRGSARKTRPQTTTCAQPGLDDEQRRAVDAHDGVVQVIAPAGSGKTTVLIERVRELLRRGTPAGEILATTFNRAAATELKQRLADAGMPEVEARTFHSTGRSVVNELGLLRPTIRQLSLNEWKRLCLSASKKHGGWIDAADARDAISDIKLGRLATPEEFSRVATDDRHGETLSLVYQLYEAHLAEQGITDYDDLVMLSVRALGSDRDLRERWQKRFSQVLVDEYQDIEPAQELLVRILAAPQDGFFCVGDEDQTLYGWRRASARRMIELDLHYPGLQRISLAHNYRCPPEVVRASRLLIEHNRVRFPKAIHAAPGREAGGDGALELREATTRTQSGDWTARALAGRRRGEIVVLARTTNLLRIVALACAAMDLRISAPEAVFEPRGARQTLEAYLRLCSRPDRAQAGDVAETCRRPNRSLPPGVEDRVAERLRGGSPIAASFAGLMSEPWRQSRLDKAGRILETLAGIGDAGAFIAHLRSAGGLDDHYAEQESLGTTEQSELEVLGEAQIEAASMTVTEYSQLLQQQADALRAVRDDRNGIELATIHGAKGRQWPEVHLFACDEQQLPHRRAFDATQQQIVEGEGIEAERRVAYVAFTRAQQRLVVHSGESEASRFLSEAGFTPKRPYTPPPTPQTRTSRVPRPTKPPPDVLSDAVRVGLGYAMRTASDRSTSLVIAWTAIEHRLIGEVTTSQRMTVAAMLEAIEGLTDTERVTAMRLADLEGDELLVYLGARGERRLALALRKLAAGR